MFSQVVLVKSPLLSKGRLDLSCALSTLKGTWSRKDVRGTHCSEDLEIGESCVSMRMVKEYSPVLMMCLYSVLLNPSPFKIV